jgi:uncharacterized membrane protein
MMNKIYHFLKYLTNNLKHPKHEVEWDIIFFLLTLLFAIVGTIIFVIKNQVEWSFVIWIETIWCWDGIRFNRD